MHEFVIESEKGYCLKHGSLYINLSVLRYKISQVLFSVFFTLSHLARKERQRHTSSRLLYTAVLLRHSVTHKRLNATSRIIGFLVLLSESSQISTHSNKKCVRSTSYVLYLCSACQMIIQVFQIDLYISYDRILDLVYLIFSAYMPWNHETLLLKRVILLQSLSQTRRGLERLEKIVRILYASSINFMQRSENNTVQPFHLWFAVSCNQQSSCSDKHLPIAFNYAILC